MANEIFIMLGWAWDIDLAAQLATRHPTVPGDLQTLGWARAVIRIDPTHARTAELTRPLLAVPIPNARTPLVIDGWHRLHRAMSEGIAELPVIVLDETDERACRIRGGDT
jgi:hypothetical protein